MIESTIDTGDTGILIVQDNTDNKARTVVLMVQSTSPVAISQMPWSWTLDDKTSGVKSFNFQATTVRQTLGIIYGGYGQHLTLHLGNTHTAQLGGPTDLEVDLKGGVSTARIKVGDVYKTAVPYVKVDGVWKMASAWVAANGFWTQSV